MWQEMLIKWKEALLARDVESFLIHSVENSREMKTKWTSLNDIAKYTEWLEMKAAEEKLNIPSGSFFMSIAGIGGR